jgi:site-specific DNA-methyltransferase (adenine-specific)
MLENKILLLDCLEGLKGKEDNSIDTIIIDPPYNIGKDFGNDSDKQPMDDYLKWVKEWVSESYRTLKDGGSMFIYGFSETLAYIFTNIEYKTKKWLIWHYTNKTTPGSKFWQRSHESIIQVWKGKTPLFNVDEVREEYTESFIKNSAGKKRKGTKSRFGEKDTIYNANEKGALPRDVIKVAALAGGAGLKERYFYCETCDLFCEPKNKKEHQNHQVIIHPTQKPLTLSEKLIKSSIPDNVKPNILIIFAGSGSECVVAKKLGCNFEGYEINEKYVKLGNSWLDNTNLT